MPFPLPHCIECKVPRPRAGVPQYVWTQVISKYYSVNVARFWQLSCIRSYSFDNMFTVIKGRLQPDISEGHPYRWPTCHGLSSSGHFALTVDAEIAFGYFVTEICLKTTLKVSRDPLTTSQHDGSLTHLFPPHFGLSVCHVSACLSVCFCLSLSLDLSVSLSLSFSVSVSLTLSLSLSLCVCVTTRWHLPFDLVRFSLLPI